MSMLPALSEKGRDTLVIAQHDEPDVAIMVQAALDLME